jgi:hypothetical protein
MLRSGHGWTALHEVSFPAAGKGINRRGGSKPRSKCSTDGQLEFQRLQGGRSHRYTGEADPAAAPSPQPASTDDVDMLSEILNAVRGLARSDARLKSEIRQSTASKRDVGAVRGGGGVRLGIPLRHQIAEESWIWVIGSSLLLAPLTDR